jgi:hypothetical protein
MQASRTLSPQRRSALESVPDDVELLAIPLQLDPEVLALFCSDIRDARHSARIKCEMKGRDINLFNKEYRERHLASGLCYTCNNLLDPHSVRFCTEHLKKERERDRNRQPTRLRIRPDRTQYFRDRRLRLKEATV